jgi:hypothetical protein
VWLFELARVLVRLDHVARCIVNANNRRVKYWEIIADNLSKAGWSLGCVSTINSKGQTIFVADAHRDDGRRKTMNLFPVTVVLLTHDIRPIIRSADFNRGVVTVRVIKLMFRFLHVLYWASIPPSTTREVPVVNFASSEQR